MYLILTLEINRYNLYGANKDLKSVFGDVQRFLRFVSCANIRLVKYIDESQMACRSPREEHSVTRLHQRGPNYPGTRYVADTVS